MSMCQKIVENFTEEARKFDQKYVPLRIQKVFDYNLPLGKHRSGISTVLAYKTLSKSEENTTNRLDSNLELANYLGWCVDMSVVAILVLDDIMDNSEFRRGQVCWHKVDGVHMNAINDAILIDNAVYFILKKYFREKSYYVDCLELFRQSSLVTSLGQKLDTKITQNPIEEFTSDAYRALITLKSSYNAVYLPIALAMKMVGMNDTETYDQVKGILIKYSSLLQIDNDFSDYQSGTIGTDIQNNKCTWLAVTCIERATKAQKQLFMQNYGQNDVVKVNTIIKMYDEMCITDAYQKHQKELYNNILIETEQLPTENLRKVIYNFLDLR